MQKAIQDMQKSNQELVKPIVDKRYAKNTGAGDDDRTIATDRMNAIAGFEFKQSLPIIKDSDPDLERHTR